MKTLALLFALLLPNLATAGAYEDMEEALISGNTSWAIELLGKGMDVNSVDAAGNTLLMQTVQRPGGRRMPAGDWLRAHPLSIGDRLGREAG